MERGAPVSGRASTRHRLGRALIHAPDPTATRSRPHGARTWPHGARARSRSVARTLHAILPRTLALAAALWAPAASADEADINAILGGTTPDTTAATGTTGAITGGAMTGGATPRPDGAPERWLDSDEALDHLAVISVHPLPGESCRDVLFEIRPTKRVRHAASPAARLELELDRLCVLGFRNESDTRTLLLRVGEELRTVAITSDARLYSGMAIGPGQEVQAPIRPLPVDRLSVGVEALWDDERDASSAIDAFTVEIVSAPPA